MATKSQSFYATGRRKTAIARVWLTPGSGAITINKRDIDNYFGRPTSKMVLRQPLEATESVGKYDIQVNVCGGGLQGQARVRLRRRLAVPVAFQQQQRVAEMKAIGLADVGGRTQAQSRGIEAAGPFEIGDGQGDGLDVEQQRGGRGHGNGSGQLARRPRRPAARR